VDRDLRGRCVVFCERDVVVRSSKFFSSFENRGVRRGCLSVFSCVITFFELPFLAPVPICRERSVAFSSWIGVDPFFS